jgi:hypothetical protein
MGDQIERFAVEAQHRAKTAVAQPVGGLDNGVEHGLDIARRARDHPQDLGRRGLPLERLLGFVE